MDEEMIAAAGEALAEGAADEAPETEETNAQELAEELAQGQTEETGEDESPEQKEDEGEEGAADERIEQYKKGLMTLLEDGWTGEELEAFAKDAGVAENMAKGMTVRQAARAYLKAGGEAKEKPQEPPKRHRGVPTSKATSMGAGASENMIEKMTDAQFAEFSKRAEREMMAGKKVRFD